MKTWKRILYKAALVPTFLVLAFQVGLSRSGAEVRIEVKQAETLTVHIEQIAPQTEVSVRNDQDEPVYSETISPSQHVYDKTFDLSSLESGNYMVTVRTGNHEIRQPFSLREHIVTIDHKKRFEIFLPQINISQESIDLNLLNRRLATVKITILDNRGDLVYEDLVPNVLSVQKRYNIRHLENGHYTLVVRTPERVFYQDFLCRK